MEALFALSIQGSVAMAGVFFLDKVLGGRMQARWRRSWWIIMPVAFLVPWKISILPRLTGESPMPSAMRDFVQVPIPIRALAGTGAVLDWLFVVWIAGAAVSLLLLLLDCWQTSRRWASERFSTDSALLSLLEDCKAQAGVRAPIGIIISGKIQVPAILGWLRPRILLPAELADPMVLRHVLLHELAHFRGGDVPIGWLYALVRCVHWFNPLAYLAGWLWQRFREEAADEEAVRVSEPAQYGETLVYLAGASVPCGAIGISESFSHLKTRISKIMKYHQRTPNAALALLILTALAAALLLRPAQAEEDPKASAVAAMETWLKGIDQGGYEESWQEASAAFRDAVTKAQWVAALNAVRGPLGKCQKRELASAAYQTEIPENGKVIKGDFVIAQFDTAYANMKYTVETVTFMKDDGVWKAAGYYVKPGS
jgi:beta-lactamase regulating signal transducer with metallopeptidase domain